MSKYTKLLCALSVAIGTSASEIIVSWETNGMLLASGMEPGTAYSVEWSSDLKHTFTNGSPAFEGVADDNGSIRIAIPMYFRVTGVPVSSVPKGMVEIPAGINSGSNPLASGETYDQHYPASYTLTNDLVFYMDATEVTKLQWDLVYNWATNNNYTFSNAHSGKEEDHPVHGVNWYDCVKWCNARSQMEGKTPSYTVGGNVFRTGESEPDCDLDAEGYRLPTSEEWEYAARGGFSGRRFPWGDTITHSNANYYGSSSYAYDTSPTLGFHPDYDDGGYNFPFTSPVGDFAPNEYGLYDMSGNLSEWCTDWHPDHVGLYRMIRSSGFGSQADAVRCGHSGWSWPDNWGEGGIGFRSVLPTN